MADKTFTNLLPPTKAVDLGDGTHALAARIMNLGNLGSTAYMVPDDAEVLEKAYAAILEGLGYPVEVGDGVLDNDKFETLVDAIDKGEINIGAGTLAWSGYEYLKSYLSVRGNPGARLLCDTDNVGIFYVDRLGGPGIWNWMQLEADAANWTVESGTSALSNDAVVVEQGTGSLKSVVTALVGGYCEIKRTFVAADLSKAAVFSLWIRQQSGATGLVTVKLWSGAAYISKRFNIGEQKQFVEVFFPFDSYDGSSGTFDQTAIDGISIVVNKTTTWNFDWLRWMVGFITLDNFRATGDSTNQAIGDDTLIATWPGVAFSTIKNLALTFANDEALELHGNRWLIVDGCTLEQRYNPTASGGGPALDAGPGEGAGVYRNRFCKFINLNIINAQQAGFSLCGDFNLLSNINVVHVGSTLGSSIGLEIRHTYTTDNLISGVTVEEAGVCIQITESAYGNIIERFVGRCRRNGTVVKLAATCGPGNKLLSFKGYGTTEGGPLGTGVDFLGTGADRTVIGGAGEWYFLATAIDIANANEDVRVEGQWFRSCTTGVNIAAGCLRTIVRNNKYDNVATPIVDAGTDTQFDLDIMSIALDLSGGAADMIVFNAIGSFYLCGYTVLYSEASSANAGVNIRVGRLQAGGAFDDDYYDIVASTINEALGYSVRYRTADLLQHAIATGESVTVGTAGGKVGTGEVKIILHIARLQ